MTYPRWQYRQTEDGAIDKRIVEHADHFADQHDASWKDSPAGMTSGEAAASGCEDCDSLRDQLRAQKATFDAAWADLSDRHEELKEGLHAAQQALLGQAVSEIGPVRQLEIAAEATGTADAGSEPPADVDQKSKRGKKGK